MAKITKTTDPVDIEVAAPAAPQPTPILFGFEEEPPKASNGFIDGPVVMPAPVAASGELEVGSFVGFGVEHITQAGAEWTVDPATGLVTRSA